MEKMNQVSVSEFFAKSKEEMYDMAVEMVEKYNRLVDICNDSAERMAELVIERDNLSKGVQKLIAERDKLIERHSVYTSALNKDIAAKAAKIELLEKEIEGRKEGYIALKKRMDTDYITIDEHNNICEDFKNKIAELEEKVKHQRENLDGINKTLEIRTKENESLIKVRNNLNKEIEVHESENARLSEKIMKLHGTITELSHDIDNYKSWNASLHKDIKELKKKEEDDYGKSGFKRYIEHLIEEEERAVPERFKERLNEEITEIFTKEEEETEVNDIPCGGDAIE